MGRRPGRLVISALLKISPLAPHYNCAAHKAFKQNGASPDPKDLLSPLATTTSCGWRRLCGRVGFGVFPYLAWMYSYVLYVSV